MASPIVACGAASGTPVTPATPATEAFDFDAATPAPTLAKGGTNEKEGGEEQEEEQNDEQNVEQEGEQKEEEKARVLENMDEEEETQAHVDAAEAAEAAEAAAAAAVAAAAENDEAVVAAGRPRRNRRRSSAALAPSRSKRMVRRACDGCGMSEEGMRKEGTLPWRVVRFQRCLLSHRPRCRTDTS